MRGNTITIVMSDKRGKMAKTIPLYQYDYGQRLIIENADLPSSYEVHFSNELHGESITMIGDSTGVDIPDEFITTGLAIYLWVFLHDTSSDGETEYTGVIPVIKRAYPSDEEPTPQQQSAITQAIAALNAGVETVTAAVDNVSSTVNTALAEAKASGEFDGADGQDGQDGADGEDGYSPTITAEQISGGYEITITDVNGSSTIDILNGAPGQNGSDGQTGPAGQDGADGYSPTATVTKSGSTATISITDKNGTTTTTVSDGEQGEKGDDGDPGEGVPTGGTSGQVLRKVSSTDYDTEWADPSVGVQIDDTAGSGDTGVTWSANKLTSELADKYEKPSGGIPSTDLTSAVQTSLEKADSAYQLPSGGIPSTDMASAVQTSLGKADSAYQKPSGGVPSTDMTSAVQTSLGKADTAYQKPSGGIPSTDLASGVIPDVSGKLDAPSVAGTNGQVLTSDGQGGQSWKTPGGGGGGVEIDDTAGIGDTNVTWSANKSATELATKYVKPSGGIPSTDIASGVIPDVSGKLDAPSTAGTNGQVLTSDGQGGQSWQTPSAGTITDVQVNGTSVVSSGTANIPVASYDGFGVTKVKSGYGVYIDSNNAIRAQMADSSLIKAGAHEYRSVVPYHQHEAVFYGLAKAAGANMASLSSTTVGEYPDAQKIAIQKMLGIYESPWELIREDTVTNATSANIEIAVDNNGNTFQLTSAILLFETPKQATQAKKEGYGAYYFYYKDTQNNIAGIGGTWTQAANADANGCSVVVESKDDLVIVTCQSYGSSGNFNNMRRGYKEGFTGQTQSIQVISGFYISSVSITSVTGTGHYKLFGKRKWT